MTASIDPTVAPSGDSCVECDSAGGWWFHLRRCAQCGHVGCCDSSPSQHARAHAASTGHPIIQTFEPDEDWFWDYERNDYFQSPSGHVLADPQHHPRQQSVPGPADRVPPDWRLHIH